VAPYFEVPARRREDELAQAKQAGAPVCPWESPVTWLNRKIWGPRPLRAYGPEGEMGRGLGLKERSSLTIANIESSFHEQSLTIPPAKLVGFGSY
jgi:hypothetical protein